MLKFFSIFLYFETLNTCFLLLNLYIRYYSFFFSLLFPTGLIFFKQGMYYFFHFFHIYLCAIFFFSNVRTHFFLGGRYVTYTPIPRYVTPYSRRYFLYKYDVNFYYFNTVATILSIIFDLTYIICNRIY